MNTTTWTSHVRGKRDRASLTKNGAQWRHGAARGASVVIKPNLSPCDATTIRERV